MQSLYEDVAKIGLFFVLSLFVFVSRIMEKKTLLKVGISVALLSLFVWGFTPISKALKFAKVLQKLPISSIYLGPPKGYIFTKELRAKGDLNYQPIVAAQKVTTGGFAFIGDKKEKFELEIPEAFVLELDQTRVYGRDGVIIMGDDLILADTSFDWHDMPRHEVFRKLKFPKLQKYHETIAVIGSKGADCLYHWMFEILPRFELLRRSGKSYDKIYMNSLSHPFQRETLKKLGADFDKMIFADKKTHHLLVDKLIVPSVPGDRTDLIPVWVCDFLREKFLPPEISPDSPKRVYISRRKARRKLLNEPELLTELKKVGFQDFLLEEMPFEKQVELFAGADMIVAPHGAGLSHLVFCKPGTQVVEIFTPTYPNSCYWFLCCQMKHDYVHFVGTQEGLKLRSERDKYDCMVDVGKVMAEVHSRLPKLPNQNSESI